MVRRSRHSVALVAVFGSVVLLSWRWKYAKISPSDLLKKTPWHIFVFAYGMYVIIYGLNNIGLTNWLIRVFQPLVTGRSHSLSSLRSCYLSY